MTRARNEASIRYFTDARAFKAAIARELARAGLSIFTDEAIERLRERAIRDAWLSRKINRENRNRRAA